MEYIDLKLARKYQFARYVVFVLFIPAPFLLSVVHYVALACRSTLIRSPSPTPLTVAFHRADFHIQLASVALLYYDYFLTLPHEIKYIWSAPRKLSSFFYFCCRYALIANLLWTFTKVGKEEVGLGAVRYHERGFRVRSSSLSTPSEDTSLIHVRSVL